VRVTFTVKHESKLVGKFPSVTVDIDGSVSQWNRLDGISIKYRRSEKKITASTR